MTQPLVTVIVTTWQHAQYIRQCLDSIVCQQVSFPVQVLVVDDASTDGTATIIAEYAQKYPQLIDPVLLETNIGLTTPHKFQDITLPRVKGRYIAFCEGDDYWTYPHKLQRQADFLNSHPDYSACLNLYAIHNETGLTSVHAPHLRRSREISAREMILEHLAHLNGTMLRAEIFQSDPEFWEAYPLVRPYTDILVFASMGKQGKVFAFKGHWSVYRIHNRGIFTSLKINTQNAASIYIKKQRLIGVYYGPDSRMMRYMQLYIKLERWTMLRKDRRIAKALAQLLRTFAYFPTGFIRLYFNRYIL